MAGFRRLGEEIIHRGDVVTMARVHCIDPEGRPFDREVVHHPGAVAVVAIEDGSVYLVRQYRAAVNAEVLEVPAGKRDVAGEDPVQTARRELAEEVGLSADRVMRLAQFHPSPGFCDEIVIVCLATGLSPTSAAPQGVEERHIEAVKVRVDEIPELMATGELADAKSIIGLYLARDLLAAEEGARRPDRR